MPSRGLVYLEISELPVRIREGGRVASHEVGAVVAQSIAADALVRADAVGGTYSAVLSDSEAVRGFLWLS